MICSYKYMHLSLSPLLLARAQEQMERADMTIGMYVLSIF